MELMYTELVSSLVVKGVLKVTGICLVVNNFLDAETLKNQIIDTFFHLFLNCFFSKHMNVIPKPTGYFIQCPERERGAN